MARATESMLEIMTGRHLLGASASGSGPCSTAAECLLRGLAVRFPMDG